MACILHIETSTTACSVAVSENSQVIFQQAEQPAEGQLGGSAEKLGPMVDEAMSFTDSHAIPFDAVAVSCGPGSYTGLRIGVSMAKGICYGQGLKLISVPTLQLLCVPVLLREAVREEDALLCPMIDARRMEVYAAVYDRALREVRPIGADVVEAGTYLPYLERGPVCFFGNGAAKCREVIRHPNAIFIPDIHPLARHMCPLAERAVARGEYQDVAYFEPFYLKEFIAIKSKNLL